MGIKKGTKLTSTPKDIIYQVRVDEEMDKKARTICKKLNLSKSQVIRKGIEELYQNLETTSQ